jgi:small subunit ribosomal protein S1
MEKDSNEINQDDTLSLPKTGEVVKGKIIGTKGSAIFIDLGHVGTGIIFGKEFYEAKDFLKNLKPESEISAKVLDPDNEEGYIELSLKQANEELAWKTIQEQKEKQETINVKILGVNKGGLLTKVSGIPAFLPVSQLSFEHYPRVEQGDKLKIVRELQNLIGEELKVKLFDINQKEKNIILSEKAGTISKLKEVFKELKPGTIVQGEITGIVDFGAFVRFSLPSSGAKPKEDATLEGLIHISEMDWQMIDNPSKVVKIGEKIKAKIIEVAYNRVSLSLKALKKNPWENVEKKYKKGDIIKAKATKFNPFGAFIQISPEIQGLVHISEFGNEDKMKNALELGKEYDFQILQVEPKERKIALKLKS